MEWTCPSPFPFSIRSVVLPLGDCFYCFVISSWLLGAVGSWLALLSLCRLLLFCTRLLPWTWLFTALYPFCSYCPVTPPNTSEPHSYYLLPIHLIHIAYSHCLFTLPQQLPILAIHCRLHYLQACLFPAYSLHYLPVYCPFTAHSLAAWLCTACHCLCSTHSLSIQLCIPYLFSVRSLKLRIYCFLFAVYSLSTVYSTMYSLCIHCLSTVYPLSIHCLSTV